MEIRQSIFYIVTHQSNGLLCHTHFKHYALDLIIWGKCWILIIILKKYLFTVFLIIGMFKNIYYLIFF